MARIGSFVGPSTPYGVPTAAVHPTDNNIIPTNEQAQADELKAQADDLFNELQNAQRDPNAK